MKVLMTGNEAVARGAYEAGLHVFSGYPGTPSTEILNIMPIYKEVDSEVSTNEKVAMEVAIGASTAGGRAMCTMKHAGLNVAADPLFIISYIGTNGGLIIVSADDPNIWSSGNEQDNRLYASHAKVAMIEPADSQECKDYVKVAFEVSEKYDIPVLYRMTTRVCHTKSPVELGERTEVPVREYVKNINKNYMLLDAAMNRHKDLEFNRMVALGEFSEKTELNRIEWGDTSIGIIANGAGYQSAKEAMGDKASYLKLGFTHPLPEKKIREFASGVDKLYIVEENEPYIENFVKQLGIPCTGKEVFPICGELNKGLVLKGINGTEPSALNFPEVRPFDRPSGFCAGCPHIGFFYELAKYKKKGLIGSSDIGCYGHSVREPYAVADMEFVMGSSIGAAIGFKKAADIDGRKERVFAFLGDSTFFHTGINGLADAVYNRAGIVVCILNNYITAATGHQENPNTGRLLDGSPTTAINIPEVVRAMGVDEEHLRVFSPYDLEATKEAIKAAYEADGLFVLITEQPCVLIKDIAKKMAGNYYTVEQDKCIGCRQCINTGCPAIIFQDNRASIEESGCVGCSICAQVCPVDAISAGGK